MSKQFGDDIITITDEEGNDFHLEHLDTLEIDGVFYLAFVPADMDPQDPDYGMILLREEEEGDEIYLAQLESDEEKEKIYELFMDRLYGDEEAEDEDSSKGKT